MGNSLLGGTHKCNGNQGGMMVAIAAPTLIGFVGGGLLVHKLWDQPIIKELEKKEEDSTSPQKFSLTQEEKFQVFLTKLNSFKDKIIEEKYGGKDIAVMGNICAGKSSLINALFGKYMCKTGLGRDTLENEKVGEIYGCSIYDCCGNSDLISYMELVFLKFMKLIVIVYDNSPLSCARLIKVCDALGVKFIVVRNKVDSYDEEEDSTPISHYKEEEENMIATMIENKDLFQGLFFLSARNKFKNEDPSKFFDWESFVNHLSTIAWTPAQ